ncbi:hypothetical protein B0H14DRAFT_673094 [Mycena olivaceomarginata]|nr:hypothetical protein B0H14DRAFT_673094 [Mycena olivaceomarginata]
MLNLFSVSTRPQSLLRSFTHCCSNLLSFFLQVGAQWPSHKSSHPQHPPTVRRSRKDYAILGCSLASSNIGIRLKTGLDSKTSRASTFQDFKPSTIQLQAVKACSGLSVPAFSTTTTVAGELERIISLLHSCVSVRHCSPHLQNSAIIHRYESCCLRYLMQAPISGWA